MKGHEVTQLLEAWSEGDPHALDHLIPLVMDDLRRLARSFMARQSPGHTLDPTALVHEAYVRLVGRRTMSWENRTQFFAYMATTMRRILVDHARERKAAKRGGGDVVALDDLLERVDAAVAGRAPGSDGAPRGADLLDLDEALTSLAALDGRQGRIVELRFFGGLTVEETAHALDTSPRTVKREWRSARLWLLRALAS